MNPIHRLVVSIAVFGMFLCSERFGFGVDTKPVQVPPSLTSFIPDPATVQRQGPAWKFPQSGWIVLHIEGEPYERGYQQGRLLAAEIVDYIKTLATSRSQKSPADGWKQYRLLTHALFLKRFHTEYLEEMKGIADGAADAGAEFDDRRVDFIDIVGINSDVEASFLEEAVEASPTGIDGTKFGRPKYSSPKPKQHERCSAFVATGTATRDGKIVLGHITMTELQFARHYNVWLDIVPTHGERILMQTFPGSIQSGLDYYLCGSGLVIAETTLPQTHFQSEGMMLASRIRQAAQYAKTIDEVVATLSDSNNGLYTNEWLIGDTRSNEIAMFELGTQRTKLWRSSRNEWHSGAQGFYWGCNNTKDRGVLSETIPDLKGKPGNLVLHPQQRDAAWLRLFAQYRGRIDAAFGFTAFSTPPLVGYPSCDAKFTTADMASEFKTWALRGPPCGASWDVTSADREAQPGVHPLVTNDWTVLHVSPPAAASNTAVDLEPFPEPDDDAPSAKTLWRRNHPFAWRGTLLPRTDSDLWLAAAFSDFERVVALENTLRLESKHEALDQHARDLLELALFRYESACFAATKMRGKNLQMTAAVPRFDDLTWYPIVVGKGVQLLARLRERLGAVRFDRLMDEFGRAHTGREVGVSDLIDFDPTAKEIISQEFAQAVAASTGANSPLSSASIPGSALTRRLPPWSVYAFEEEPQRSLIVYGTQRDAAAQRESAEHLRRSLARRFHNYWIPNRSDEDVTAAELREQHIILVGRPATNAITRRWIENFPVRFGPDSVIARKQFAHPLTWVIAAGENGDSDRYSAVVFAGLSAQATADCVQSIDPDDPVFPQVIVQPYRHSRQTYRANAN